MKEVILLGSGDSAYDCPFNAELWTTAAMLPNIDPDCAKVFAFGSNSKEGREIAIKANIPIVSTEAYATEKFPYAEIVKEFAIDYFRSPLSYMLAYAIHLGYEKIGIYGFDLEDEDEYKVGKSRITFWLGVATGRGIIWEIGRSSKLYRVLKDNVKDRYKRAMELRDGVTPEDYVATIKNHGDPYTWVSGVDRDAVTVKNYDQNGKEVSSWHP